MVKQAKKEKIKLKTFKINQKTLTVLTFIIYIFAMIVFEIGYCNASNIVKWINGNLSEIQYNFSLCRIIFYVVFLVGLYLVKQKFIKEALNVAQSKCKQILIYVYLLLGIFTIIVAMIVIVKNPLLTRGMSIGIISVLMGAIFILYVSNHILKNMIITLASIGIIFSITVDFNHAIDEKKHFMSAFNIASGNFRYNTKPITDKQIEALPQLSKFTTIDPFLEERYEANLTEEVNREDVPSTPASYSFINYLFPAMGIWIAKTLGGSIIDLYIMGRVFNLILYGILICIAIKLIPYKKNIFAVLFLMPMALVLAGTYSIDGFCIGVVSIFIAYCLKIKKEKTSISLKDFVILMGLFILALFAKSMAYLLVGIIFLILPLKETLKKNKKYIPLMIVITIILSVLLVFIVLKVKETKITSDTRAGGNINVSEQIDYIVHNPVSDIKLAINHINDTFFNFSWYGMLHDNKFFAESQLVLIPMILFILYIAITEEDYHFKGKDKIIMLMSFLFVYGMTSMVLYLSFSPVGALHIGGYQTRYILPIVSLPLFCLSNKNLVLKNKENRTLKIAGVSGIFILLSVAQVLLV